MYSQTQNPKLGFLGLHGQLCASLVYHKSQDLNCDCHSIKARIFIWMLRMSRELNQTQPKENIWICKRNFCKSASSPMFLMWQPGTHFHHPSRKPQTCLSALQALFILVLGANRLSPGLSHAPPACPFPWKIPPPSTHWDKALITEVLVANSPIFLPHPRQMLFSECTMT